MILTGLLNFNDNTLVELRTVSTDKHHFTDFILRHVVLPKEIAKLVPKTRLMSEEEWRSIGVTMSAGWVHYMIHKPGKLFCLLTNHSRSLF